MAKKKIKRVPRGQALPPEPEEATSAEAMQAWGNGSAAVDAQKYGSAEFNAMLAAELLVDEVE